MINKAPRYQNCHSIPLCTKDPANVFTIEKIFIAIVLLKIRCFTNFKTCHRQLQANTVLIIPTHRFLAYS